MNDREFEDEAAIQILVALISSGVANFKALYPQNIEEMPAGYAEKAWTYAKSLLEHRRTLRRK
jgi:hypothetical protein